ncbi:MAG: type II toxin-antitoxin system VapC family toxin [Gemmatimonadota bacterium]|nr:type II toxin-antitoxin system VapC family toxin [Gemmatimonadota bacterium]
MIFIDANIPVYAVGRPHPLREQARAALKDAKRDGETLVTSAEVFQEILHVYVAVDRDRELENAWALLGAVSGDVWPVERADADLARSLRARHPELTARDLVHLACCRRRDVEEILTFDRGLKAAVSRRSG